VINSKQPISKELIGRFQLHHGPLIKVIYSENSSLRLTIMIHHLAVDGVSWRIILEDLFLIYTQLLQQKTRKSKIQLPEKTTSYKFWAVDLLQQAQSAWVKHELNYWQRQLVKAYTPSMYQQLKIDCPENIASLKQHNTYATQRQFTLSLDKEI